jgi:hypothetical protein
MIKKRYEVIEDGTLYPYNSFEKNREGLEQAYEQAEQTISDRGNDLDQLEIQCVTYDSMDRIVSCEIVDDLINHNN